MGADARLPLAISLTAFAITFVAVAGPAAMVFAVVATANHFVLDVVVGVALVLAGLLAAGRLSVRTLGGGELEIPRAGRSGRPALRRRPSLGLRTRSGCH